MLDGGKERSIMKKTTQKVFARILSLALVMALMLTSIMSSLVFTVSATETEYYKEVIDFEDGALPEGDVMNPAYCSIEAAPDDNGGSYSFYCGYNTTTSAYADFKSLKLTKDVTYLISYDYYEAEAKEGETDYSPWHGLYPVTEADNKQGTRITTTKIKDGQWYNCTAEYTPSENVYLKIVCNKGNMYFDNIIVKTKNTSAYQAYDFDAFAPQTFVTKENTTDKNGKLTTALKVETKSDKDTQNYFYLDADLVAGKMYKISFDYKGKGYLRSYASLVDKASNAAGLWDNRQFFEIGQHVALSSDTWVGHEAVFTSDKAHNAINFLTSKGVTDGTLYIDNVVIEEYELGFDYYSVDFENGTTIIGGASNNFEDKVVTDPTNSNNKVLYKAATSSATPYNITTPRLEAGKTYAITISAYGTAESTWFGLYAMNGANQISIGGCTANNTAWKTFPKTYTASADGEYIRILTQNAVYIDNIIIKEVIINTADKQVYDFDKGVPQDISGAANSSIESVEGADGKTSNAIHLNASSALATKMFKLDVALTQGKVYKLSYNYKGDIDLRFLLYNGTGWSNSEMYSAEEWITRGDSASLSSTDWATREITFTAQYNSSAIYLLADSGNGFIDNIIIEESAYEAFDKYTFGFEQPLVNKANGGFAIADAPNGKKALYHSITSGSTFYLNAPRLLAGHKYYVTFNYYADSEIDNGAIKLTRYNKTSKVIDYTDTAVAGEWRNFGEYFTADTDGELLAVYAGDKIYFTDITVVDITNKLNNTEMYSEDFSNRDEATLLQSRSTNIEYVLDEGLDKNIAVVDFKNNDWVWVKVPYLMQNGVQYRVKMTYKSTEWFAPYFNGEAQTKQGANAIDEWTNAYWYITGNGDNDYFAFGNWKSLTVQIASIEIEELTLIEGDINNDGEIVADDLVLFRKYLLGVDDEEIFAGKHIKNNDDQIICLTGNADVNEDGVVDIKDLVRLKKMLCEVAYTDDASSLTAVAYATENVAVTTDTAEKLEDQSSFKVAVSGKDAYIVYKLNCCITEAAVEYDIRSIFMGDFSFEVSHNGKTWTEVTAQDISKEEINSNSWVRVTEYFGELGNVSYFKINFPETVADDGELCHVRTVQINGLTADTLYELKGYNSLLREAETVYVSNSGDDNNSGLSENAPLKTLSAAFDRMLVPGDKILLECGSTFEGEVKILSSGTEAAPITVGSYGEGEKPIITGFETAIKVTGEYVKIDGLAFTDADAFSAVDFYALKEGATKGVGVTNCAFYEINTVAETGTHSRSSGGVHFLAKGNKPSWFDGVTVCGNTFNRVGRNAIYVTSDWAARDTEQEWGVKNFMLDGSPVYLSKNIIIRNNDIKNNSGDAITVIGTDGTLIEYNTVADSKLLYNVSYAKDPETNDYILDENGNRELTNVEWVSIWCYASDNCVMQYNEVYGNRADNRGQDLQAFDIDISCNNCIIQYNYSHDNDGGFLLLCGKDSVNNAGVNGSIVRYNLSVNDASKEKSIKDVYYSIIDITGSVANSQIYNNTIYCDYEPSSETDYKTIRLVNFANYRHATVESSNTVFTNNIFYVEDNSNINPIFEYGTHTTAPAFQDATFDSNVFYNVDTLPKYVENNKDLITVKNTITTKPTFINAGVEANGRSNGENYKVTNINALVGAVIENNGGLDYLGNTVFADSTLIGAIK